MDFSSKIAYVVNNTLCSKHGANEYGVPCWWIRGDQGIMRFAGICNRRASMIYTGQPQSQSRNNKRPKKES
jgi:hypothetical protein